MLGSDPELFLKDKNGAYVSAIGLIGGSKDFPRPVKKLGKGFTIQEDNVLCEFNIPPAKTQIKWVNNHNVMLEYLNEYLASKGLSFSIDASAEMPKEALGDPRAHVFGCDPDFNVWTLKPNPRPNCSNPFLRSAGGHVHVTFSGTNADKVMFGRRLDATLGLWSVINDPDTRRKELYGKAGAIRFKPYGIEYRVLSNFWLKNTNLMSKVWYLVEIAKKAKWEPAKEIVEAINNNNISACKTYLSMYGGV
jgi:hypothetical protein